MPFFKKKQKGSKDEVENPKLKNKGSSERRSNKSSNNLELSDLRIYVNDKIRIKNKREGRVTSIGPKADRSGLWIRLAIESDGSEAASPRQKAVWIPIQRVDKVLDTSSKYRYTVGDRVVISKKKLHGTVRYVGPTTFEKGVWFGIELDTKKGMNNGTVKHKFYFECQKNYGLFVPQKKLELEKEEAGETKKSKRARFAKNPTVDANPPREVDMNDDEVKESDEITNGVHKNGVTNGGASNGSAYEYGNSSNSNTVSESEERDLAEPVPTQTIRGSGHLNFQEKVPLMDFLPLYDDHDGRSEKLLAELQQGKPKKRKITLKGLHKDLYESKLPALLQAPKSQREQIFRQKLRLCRAHCPFTDLTKVKLQMIEKKEKILTELSEFIARHHWFKQELFVECLHTISSNLFRSLPYQYRPPSLCFFNDEVFDKDTNFEDPAWRHLKLVYDLSWRVINTQQVTAQMMEKYMQDSFLDALVELFASEDHRERAYLMMILHKIYGRCLKLRPYIIDLICKYLYRMIYTDDFDHFNGIIELLQIICAIIPGLTVPVKDTWQKFLRNILVPLHKCRGLKKFWEQLTQCCVNYVAKDGQGGAVILGGLLKYWPKQSPQKEEIFIMEVVNIINVLINHQEGFVYENYKVILIAAAHQLTLCMLSTRQPVAERAIAAWKEQSMQHLVDYDRKAFLPKLAEAFHKNKDHHNQQLRMSSNNVEKIYKSKDSQYWKKMQQYLNKKERKEKEAADAAAEAMASGKLPAFPYSGKKKKDSSVDKDDKNGKRIDSFVLFDLEETNSLNYSHMLQDIHDYEQEQANSKKRKRKHLTKTETGIKRRAYWAYVKEMAAKNTRGKKG